MTACMRCGLDGLIGSQIDAASGWCQECLNGPIGILQQRTSAAFGIPLERLTSNLRFRIPESGTTEQENPMHRVLRWNVPVDDQWHDIGAGPVLHVASRQHFESPGDLVEVWTLEEVAADGTPPPATLPVMVVGTGHAIPVDTYHVGTAVVPAFGLVQSMLRGGQTHIESRAGLVWHVFAKHDEAYRDRLAEEGRRLASLREDLIAEGVDPSELETPGYPEERSKRADPVRTLTDEVTGLAYWLADKLGEHVDEQDDETLTDTVKRLVQRINAWPAGGACPDCGQDQVLGYGMRNEAGVQVHTHYACTFYSVPERKACGWHGWSVPGWNDPERDPYTDDEE